MIPTFPGFLSERGSASDIFSAFRDVLSDESSTSDSISAFRGILSYEGTISSSIQLAFLNKIQKSPFPVKRDEASISRYHPC